MARVTVNRFWTFISTGMFQTTANYSGIDFDTDTHTLVAASGSLVLALLDPRPSNVVSQVGAYLWFDCAADFTQTKWFYGGGNTMTTETVVNSLECGWVPPVTPTPANTCDLVLNTTVAGDVITATTFGAHGVVTYSIDGGITRQRSGVFADLAPRPYVVAAYDAGVAGCTRTRTVFVVATPPTVSPVPMALPAVAFAGNPIALRGQATRPGRALLLELFIESAHGSTVYQRLVQRLRPTGTDGSTVVELQKQLAAALRPDRPDLRRAPGLRRLTSGIRRYYAALAEIQPGTGLPGPFVFEAPRTVLLGGLSWAAARAVPDFFSPVPVRFLTWRPQLVQEVGPDHVLLHSALLSTATTRCQGLVKCYQLGESQPATVLTYSLNTQQQQNGTQAPGSEAGGGVPPRNLDPPTPWLVELQVPLTALPGNTARVTVQLVDNLGVPLTEVRTFRIDATKRRRQFVFRNSLGQWDTLSAYGPRSSKTSVERTVATTLQPPNYDPQGGTDAVVFVAADERITISTGRVTPDELHWLRELHTSFEVYEVIGDQLCSIKLTTKDFINYEDDGGSDGFVFEYQYCSDALNYVPHDWI